MIRLRYINLTTSFSYRLSSLSEIYYSQSICHTIKFLQATLSYTYYSRTTFFKILCALFLQLLLQKRTKIIIVWKNGTNPLKVIKKYLQQKFLIELHAPHPILCSSYAQIPFYRFWSNNAFSPGPYFEIIMNLIHIRVSQIFIHPSFSQNNSCNFFLKFFLIEQCIFFYVIICIHNVDLLQYYNTIFIINFYQ